MKRVVSVSLGSSKRNKESEIDLLGERFRLERVGTDGDLKRFEETFRELDGQIDCFGVGGADIYVVAGKRRYAFRQIVGLVSAAKKTPVVDGSGLKHTLERATILQLAREGKVDFINRRVLLVSGVDRFGMAEALEEVGAHVTYGDLPFGVGVPIPVRSHSAVAFLGSIILPVITKLPFKWFYPTGESQEKRTPKFEKLFREAEVILGDWHYIRRYMPNKMEGKTVVTQTLRKADLDLLAEVGVSRAITTTPMIEGETFATNVMEAAIVALLGKRPELLTEKDYLDVLQRLNWKPNIIDLKEYREASSASATP